MKFFTEKIYIRNDYGQYVGAITRAKIACILAVITIIITGLAYSISQARASGCAAYRGSDACSQENQTGGNDTSDQESVGCIKVDDVCDFTDKATKDKTALEEKLGRPLQESVTGKLHSVSAYTSRVQETDATPCISADGSNICERYAKGEKICATNDYPLGSVLAIQGLGRCIVRDRMNKRYTGTGRIDWYMGHDLISAKAWGIKSLQVERK